MMHIRQFKEPTWALHVDMFEKTRQDPTYDVQSLVVIVFRMHLVVAVLHMNANAFWLISVYKYP